MQILSLRKILIIHRYGRKKIIKEREFTIEQVANTMGITRVTLSQTLSRNPTVDTLQRIANVIGCKAGDFFADELGYTITCPDCGCKLELKKID